MATIDLSVQQNVSVGLFIYVIITYLPVMLITILGNFIVILSVYRKREKTPNSIFISSLAIFDFLTGLIGVPLCMVAFLLRRQFHYMENCAIWYYVPITIFISISVLNLIVITIDRFLAIKYPLRYHVWISTERAFRVCICVDLFGFFFAGSSFAIGAVASLFVPPPNVTYEYDCGSSAIYEMYGAPVSYYVMGPVVGLSILFLFILYAYIFSIASKKAKENATRHGKKVKKREMKVTKTAAIVLLAYTLCTAPSALKIIIKRLIDNGSTWLVWYLWFADFLIIANSMMNPLIYAGRSKVMRKEFKETFDFIICKVSSRSEVKAKYDAEASCSRKSPKIHSVTTSSANLATCLTSTSSASTGESFSADFREN
ncbi:adenosine receptor A2b-like [Anneissia japonica]|uniref:adenosine receptor A2b-like n=1 Tax=Anneissia japonica TaxID=1529436 RepID=UPI001425AA48|nr:adenosine receptor A2b-like [Anneissia japonica]